MKRLRWPPPPDGGPRSSGPGPSAPRSGRPTLPMPPTQLIETPHGGRIEQLVTGVVEAAEVVNADMVTTEEPKAVEAGATPTPKPRKRATRPADQ